MASGKNNNPLKNTPELFSEELQTVEERILEELKQQNDTTTEKSPLAPNAYNHKNIPAAQTAAAEQRISDLLNLYYNGDPDADCNHRFDHKAEYKAELIQTLRLYGISYIEKPHYPLSKAEKHVIRMDFFGRINRPHFDKLSPLYRGYLTIKENNITKEQSPDNNKSRKKKRGKQNPFPTPSIKMTIYPLNSYNLDSSKAWKLYRLFPRFHNLEYRMLKTIQSMHIPPEQLALMSVYDFSDILYRTFRKNEKSPDAHLFLGARQAFVKDVFKKMEKPLRGYFKRQNLHPRYIEALIKAAQSKGTCNDINIATDTQTCMAEYASAHAEDFHNFIIQSIKSDNYAEQIKKHIQNNSHNLDTTALHFLENTKKQFSLFIKKNLLEENYALSLYEQFSHKIPSYVLEDIQAYIKKNPQKFTQHLNRQDISPDLKRRIIKNLPDFNDLEQKQIALSFILEDQENFFVDLLENNRSSNYARYALQVLKGTPQLTDFGKDIITSFILAEGNKPGLSISPTMLEELRINGLSDEILSKISPYIRKHFSSLQNHLKQNNILTYQELYNELIENDALLIQNNALPSSNNKLHKSFILSNTPYFKDWYINFHTTKYKEDAIIMYEQIALKGINETTSGICCEFIKERLSSFMNFAAQQNLTSSEIIQNLKEDKLTKNSPLNNTIHDFIVRHNTTFKNFLLQNHLQQKEKNFDLMIKKIKQQGINEQTMGLIHKFILDNKPLYTEYQKKDKQLSIQGEQIYTRIIENKPTTQDKTILNEYLSDNIYNYMVFQQDNSQLLPYVKNIIQNVKHTNIGSVEEHWLKAYTEKTSDKFKQFLVDNHYADEQQSDLLVKDIKFTKKHMIINFDDGYVYKMPLTVHHLKAAQDSGEIKYAKLFTNILQSQESLKKFKEIREKNSDFYDEIRLENIARINDFSNLCLFTDFWHKVMHSMDSTEPFEDRERFVARLEPSKAHIVFFGSEKAEDQFCYDYANDHRTKRYNNHLNHLISLNNDYEI